MDSAQCPLAIAPYASRTIDTVENMKALDFPASSCVSEDHKTAVHS
jgi:hypothetical protein